MKINEPITNREIKFDASRVLVSKTDERGKIIFANQDFVDLSGFTSDELLGAPHNIVRHPHMPKEAFADLWATIKAGAPWEGLVKNRSKSGDHYWVRANATPIIENGVIRGYISIRTAPERDQIIAAENAYTQLLDGKQVNFSIRQGAAYKNGVLAGFLRGAGSLFGQLAISTTASWTAVCWAIGVGIWANGTFVTAAAGALVGLAIVCLLNWRLLGGIRHDLRRLEADISAISDGSVRHVVELASIAELNPLIWQLRALKAKMAFQAQEQAELERRSSDERRRASEDLARQSKEADTERLKSLQDMAITVENNTSAVIEVIAGSARDVHRIAEVMSEKASNVSRESQSVASASEQALVNAQSVSAGAEQLARSIDEISSQIGHSTELTKQAVDIGARAQQTILALANAMKRISDVTKLISDIASKTDLLALNATIEAARAGDAGKGFSVVAAEVKNLATQTTRSTEEISQQITEILSATNRAVIDVSEISAKITEIDAVSTMISAAVEEQGAATAEIARTVAQTADAAREVSSRIAQVSSESNEVGSRTTDVRTAIIAITKNIEGLKAVLIRTIRTSSDEIDRRDDERVSARLGVTVISGPKRLSTSLVDLSTGGARLLAISGIIEGQRLELDIVSIGRIRGKVSCADEFGVHVVFDAIDNATLVKLTSVLQDISNDDKQFIDIALGVSSAVESALETAISRGDIAEAELFDVNYSQIDETDPPQFLTRFTPFLDKILPAIIEPPLVQNRRIVFCAPVDLNGYLPVHNEKFSHPQRRGEPVWNAANSRNRRIFNDMVGFSAARVSKAFQVQSYQRDMGGGVMLPMKEVDVPIKVGNRQWGALRVAFSV